MGTKPRVMRKWLVFARSQQMRANRVLIVEAMNIKDAYEKSTHVHVMNKWSLPDSQAAAEIKDGEPFICTVLDPKIRGGLFNGQSECTALPLSAGAGCS